MPPAGAQAQPGKTMSINTHLVESGLAVDEHKVAVVQVAANLPIEAARILALELLGERRAELLALLRQVDLGALFIHHVVGARPRIRAVEHSLPQAPHVVLVDGLWK
jgi:hypothetical protein